jgi:hypothetical protein
MDCGSAFIKLSHKDIPEPIYLQGNAYFIPNKPLKHPAIKRLVKTSV